VTKRAARSPHAARRSTYGPGEDLERIDVALIGEAAKQIDMAAYVLTDRAVIEALRRASARGVKVRIRRDASEAARRSEFDVEAQPPARPISAGQARRARTTTSWRLEARLSARGLTPSSTGLWPAAEETRVTGPSFCRVAARSAGGPRREPPISAAFGLG
jgi:phosphatidylserine/phosphatidylglycerophosphate/cardiolipin synthase-like enzyme